MQEDVVIGLNSITGTLKYIADYSSAGYTGDEESGNFLALHISSVEGATIKAEVIGGVHGEVTLDEDGLLISRIANNTQQIKITATKDEASAVSIYDLTYLTLNAQ